MLTLVIQLLFPILLLAWFALLPMQGRIAYALQACSTAVILLTLALVALWVMPPWWVPYLYGMAYLLVVIWHKFVGQHGRPLLHLPRTMQMVSLVLVLGFGLYGVSLLLQALLGRQLPDVATVDIATPFPPGDYIVAHGGSTRIINVHLHTLDPSIDRYHAWRGQSRALDLFRTGTWGLHVDGWRPADPARYTSFGTGLLAPCAGTVALAIDGHPDMQVPEMDRTHMTGNYVAIDCGEFFVILAHLHEGSVRVNPGDIVNIGDPVGELGNSGNSSEPHLHIHAQRGLPEDAPLSGEPLGLTIEGRYPVRNDRLSW